jgi:DNA-binding transcriptional regulator YiaG
MYRGDTMTTQAPEMPAILDLVEVRALARSGRAKEIRVASALSLAEIARAIGTTAATIHRWENAARKPYGELALRYGALLDALARRLENR